MITLADVQGAAERIRGKVRRTPLMAGAPLKAQLPGTISLKLECLQVSGSFKARGAVNALSLLGEGALQRGVVTASGGNHGLALAYAGYRASAPTTIFLPATAPAEKAAKLREWGAEVVVKGTVWDEANRAALLHAEQRGSAYVHPFADPHVIAGQGTVALEILEDAPDVDTILVAVGGGGLISGVALAAKALKPGIRVIGIEPVGAPTLSESLKAGRLIELPNVATAAGTLAPRRSEAVNLELVRANVDSMILVSDEEMRDAARLLWFEFGVAAELSGAAALAAISGDHYRPEEAERVCVLVCGAGSDGIS